MLRSQTAAPFLHATSSPPPSCGVGWPLGPAPGSRPRSCPPHRRWRVLQAQGLLTRVTRAQPVRRCAPGRGERPLRTPRLRPLPHPPPPPAGAPGRRLCAPRIVFGARGAQPSCSRHRPGRRAERAPSASGRRPPRGAGVRAEEASGAGPAGGARPEGGRGAPACASGFPPGAVLHPGARPAPPARSPGHLGGARQARAGAPCPPISPPPCPPTPPPPGARLPPRGPAAARGARRPGVPPPPLPPPGAPNPERAAARTEPGVRVCACVSECVSVRRGEGGVRPPGRRRPRPAPPRGFCVCTHGAGGGASARRRGGGAAARGRGRAFPPLCVIGWRAARGGAARAGGQPRRQPSFNCVRSRRRAAVAL